MASQNIIQPSSSDSSAIVMVQNNMLLWNDISMQDDNTLLETLVSTPDFSTMEPQNKTPEGRSEPQIFLSFYHLRYIN